MLVTVPTTACGTDPTEDTGHPYATPRTSGYPWMSVTTGTDNASHSMILDLADCSLAIGFNTPEGREGFDTTCNETELSRGRELFTPDKIEHYEQQAVPRDLWDAYAMDPYSEK